MTHSKLIEAIRDVKNGSFIRIGYTTQVPIKAGYKDAGISIKKIVATTVRLGVRYKNIKKVKERQTANAANAAKYSNYFWLIHNKVKYNSKTDKLYLVAATLEKGDNTKVCYEVCDNGVYTYYFSKNELKQSIYEYVVSDYYFKNNKTSAVFNVSLDNIFRLGNYKIRD